MYGVTKRHKSPDESLKIATKHWALSLGVGIHHIGGGTTIVTAIVIRLACLERLFLISVRYDSIASGDDMKPCEKAFSPIL